MKRLDRAPAVLGAALMLAGLAACDRGAGGPPAVTPDPSAQTIDVKPAPPTGNTPGTTPVTGPQSDLTQSEGHSQMPLEGQDHSYSSVARHQSEKPGGGFAPAEGRESKDDAQPQGRQPANPQRSQE